MGIYQLAQRFKSISRTSGDLTLTSTTWANLDTGLDLTILGAVGDEIALYLSAAWGAEARDAYLNACTVVAGSPVSFFGSGEPSTTTGSGVPGWLGSSGLGVAVGGSPSLVIAGGDIAGGTVTVRLRYRLSASSKTLYASTLTPFKWRAENLGPPDPD